MKFTKNSFSIIFYNLSEFKVFEGGTDSQRLMTPLFCVDSGKHHPRACARARARFEGSLSEVLEPGRVPVFAPDVFAPHPIGILRALEKASLFLDQRSPEAPPRL